jgi:hypothetical protein
MILERFIDANPVPQSYIKSAIFEEQQRNFSGARIIYEKALAELGKRAFQNESLFIAFIKFEIRQNEFDRVRTLFEFGL